MEIMCISRRETTDKKYRDVQKKSRAFPFLLFLFFFLSFPARLCNIAIKLPGKCLRT